MAYEFYKNLKKLSEMTEIKNAELSERIKDAMECGMTSTEILMRSRYEIAKRIDGIREIDAINLAKEIIEKINETLNSQ